MKKIFAIAWFFVAITTSAFASDEGVYVVGQVGLSSNVKDVENSSSYGGLIGYQINRNWGFEFGYASLFNDAPITTGIASVTGKYSSSDVSGAAVYKMPLGNNFSLLWRLGYHNLSEKATATGPGGTFTATSNSSGPLLGFAGQYNLNENFGFRAGIDLLNAQTNGTSGTMQNFNAGIVLKF